MSISPAPQTEGYATLGDVAELFDKIDEFDGSTNPTESVVERRIRQESDWIDKHTGHAWRPRQIENEYVTLTGRYYWRAGSPIKLQKRQIITPLDPAKGDKLEVWRGSDESDDGWEDWLADDEHEYGRDEDFWVEEPTGMFYIYRRKLWFKRHKEIRLNYRFGREWPDVEDKPTDSDLSDAEWKRQNVPGAVRDACALRVAARLFESQQYRITVPGNEEAADPGQVAEKWKEQSKEILKPYKEVKRLGTQ